MKRNDTIEPLHSNPKSLRDCAIENVLKGMIVEDVGKLRQRLREILSCNHARIQSLGNEPDAKLITEFAVRFGVPAIAFAQLPKNNEQENLSLQHILDGAPSTQYKPDSLEYRASEVLQKICSTIAGQLRTTAGIGSAEQQNDMHVGLERLLEIQGKEASAHEIVSILQLNEGQRALVQKCQSLDAEVFTASKNPLTREELEKQLEKLEVAQVERTNLPEILRGCDREGTFPTLILHQSADESPTARASRKILRRWKNSRENEWMVRHIGLLLAMAESLFSRGALRQRQEDLKNYAQWQGEKFRLQKNRFHGNRKELAEELARQVRQATREGGTCDIIHPEEDVFLLFQDLLEAMQSPVSHISLQQLIESLLPMIRLRLSTELAPSDHELELLAILRLMETLKEKLNVQRTAETPKVETA